MPSEPTPSATVALLRDGADELELLLLQRTPRPDGTRGPWVFPGGKLEAGDHVGAGDDREAHARRAAVRETREEASLELGNTHLVTISRWITPEVAKRRFDTWFFLGTVGTDAAVRVDGAEMGAHRWLPPRDALAAHAADELRLAPPTFVTVTWLAAFRHAGDAMEQLARGPVLTFRPRICPTPEGACVLYPGDAGYEVGQVEHDGPRHRLWSLQDGFRYERTA